MTFDATIAERRSAEALYRAYEKAPKSIMALFDQMYMEQKARQERQLKAVERICNAETVRQARANERAA